MIIKRKHFTIIKYFFISFIFFPPLIIKVWPALDTLNEILKIAPIIIVVLLFCKIIIKRNIKISSFELLLIAFLVLINIQNIFVNVDFSPVISQSLPILSYILIMKLSTKSFHEYLIGTKVYCVLVTTGNLISQLMLPYGIYYNPVESWQPYYLCANANSFFLFYIFSFGVFLIEDYYRTRHVTWGSIIYVLSLIWSMFIGGTTNGLVILLGCFVVCLLSIGNGIKKILKHWKFLLSVFLIFALWLIGFKGWQSDLFQGFVYNYFHEDSSFVERGVIWSNAISEITKHPFIGHGTLDANLSSGFGNQKRSSHNNFLQIALFGGVPSLIIYLVLVIYSFTKLRKSSDKSSYIAGCMTAAYLIAYFFEQNPFYIGLYAMLMMMNILNTDLFKDEECEKKKN